MFLTQRLAVLCSLALALLPAAVRAEEPPVFDKRPYAEVRAAAETSKKWFIVKGTAVWCGPCKQMDKTTWVDQKVVKWLGSNALVVALDVDKSPDIAKELNIEAMPTMIAFKDGKEFDRIVGYRSADALLAWLEGVNKGETSMEVVRAKAKSKPGERVDVDAKLNLARTLASSGKYIEAADEYVWLWDNMIEHQPSMYGVRLSFMAGDMERVAAKNKDARAKFVALRDKAGKDVDAGKVDRETLVDWVVLNTRVLNEGDKVLAWYDKVKDQPAANSLIERVERDLTELLIAKQRWADIGKLQKDPIAKLEQDHDFLRMTTSRQIGGFDKARKDEMDEYSRDNYREKVSTLYAGLLAAGRDNIASTYQQRARELDKSPKMTFALVRVALDAKQSRAEHVTWLQEAAKTDAATADLIKAVQAELAASPQPKK